MVLGGRASGSDTGATTLEYIGLIVLAASVVAAIVLAAMPVQISENVRDALCRMMGGDCLQQNKADGPKDKNYLPKRCEVSHRQEKAGAAVYVGFLKFGDEYSFLEQQMANGKYRYTLMPHNGEIGVETGFGFKAKGGKNVKFGADAKVGGYFKAGVGDTWEFRNKAEAESFKDDILEHQAAMDAMARGPGSGLYYALNPPPEIPDPDMTTATGKFEAGGNGEAGAGVQTSQGTSQFDIGTGLQGKIRSGSQVAVRTDNRHPNNPQYPLKARTYQVDGEMGAASEIAGGATENLQKWSGAVRVTRNKQGKLVQIDYITTKEQSLRDKQRVGGKGGKGKGGHKGTEGDGSLQERRTTLKVNSPEDRTVAEKYLRDKGLTGMPPVALDPALDDAGSIQDQPPEGASKFDKLLHDKATVSNTTQHTNTDAQTFGAKAKAGLGLGAKISTETSEGRTVQSQYLGAPKQGGKRQFKDFPQCRAQPR